MKPLAALTMLAVTGVTVAALFVHGAEPDGKARARDW